MTLSPLCRHTERPHVMRVLRQVRNELARVKSLERWAQLIDEEIRLCELLGLDAGPEQGILFLGE